MFITLFIEFWVAIVATAAFAILFNVPKKQWIFSGLTGGIGWVFYRYFAHVQGIVVATFIAVIIVTFISRIFAIMRKSPVTIFLVSGIFPLVPGVGIYYTSYYFIMNEFSQASAKGVETLKVAMAISIGIMFVLMIPQKFFVLFEKRKVKAEI